MNFIHRPPPDRPADADDVRRRLVERKECHFVFSDTADECIVFTNRNQARALALLKEGVDEHEDVHPGDVAWRQRLGDLFLCRASSECDALMKFLEVVDRDATDIRPDWTPAPKDHDPNDYALNRSEQTILCL